MNRPIWNTEYRKQQTTSVSNTYNMKYKKQNKDKDKKAIMQKQ